MSLIAGTRLGPYEVIASLGAGGMGEVYLARDTRLDRKVAIKLLHVSSADRGVSRERFRSEAKADSSLNRSHHLQRFRPGLWSVAPLGGPARRILEFGDAPSISGDGKRIVFTRGNAIWIANADGTDAHEVAGASGLRLFYIRDTGAARKMRNCGRILSTAPIPGSLRIWDRSPRNGTTTSRRRTTSSSPT